MMEQHMRNETTGKRNNWKIKQLENEINGK